MVCLPKLRFVSISLSPILFPLPLRLCGSHTLTCKNSVPVLEMEEPNQQAALSQEWEGREKYLLLNPRGADRCCCVLALLRQCGALGREESSTEACNTSLFYFFSLVLQSRWRKWLGSVTASSGTFL